jgi:hypothetical protein
MVFTFLLNIQVTLSGGWAKITSTDSCLSVASDTGGRDLLQLRIAANGSRLTFVGKL